MAITQSQSDIVHRRIQNLAKAMVDMSDEIERLHAQNTTEDFSTNLGNHSGSQVTSADAIAFVTGPMADYRDFFGNLAVATDGTSGSSDRRDKINPYLLTDTL